MKGAERCSIWCYTRGSRDRHHHCSCCKRKHWYAGGESGRSDTPGQRATRFMSIVWEIAGGNAWPSQLLSGRWGHLDVDNRAYLNISNHRGYHWHAVWLSKPVSYLFAYHFISPCDRRGLLVLCKAQGGTPRSTFPSKTSDGKQEGRKPKRMN